MVAGMALTWALICHDVPLLRVIRRGVVNLDAQQIGAVRALDELERAGHLAVRVAGLEEAGGLELEQPIDLNVPDLPAI